MTRRLALAVLGVVCALTACGPATVPAPAATPTPASEHEATRATGTHHCGLEHA